MSNSQSDSLVPGRNVYLEMQMLGTIVSSVAYGIVLMLSYNCFSLFSVDELRSPSKRMRVFLHFFVATLFLLSTISFVHGALIISTAIFRNSAFPSLYGGAPHVLPVTLWVTDSFMIWRCFVVYQGISYRLRFMLFCLVGILYVASLGSGAALFFNFPKRFLSVIFVALSTGINLLITVLIVIRLSYHQKYLKSVLGHGYSSPYSRVIALTVESAALDLFVQIPYLILVGLQSTGRSAFILTLPHVPIIATLLIVYRVAQGRSGTRMEPKSTPDLLGSRKSSSHSNIQFQKTSLRSITLIETKTGTERAVV